MRFLALIALLASSPMAYGGVFSPNEPCPFEVSPDGVAKPLPLDVFKLTLNDRVAALNPATPEVQPGTTGTPTFKGLIVRRLKGAPQAPSRAEMVGRSADLLRLGHAREVIELLKPSLQDRTLEYALLAHMALAHAQLGDWDMAVKRFNDAFLDGEEPSELAGTKPEQLKWMLKIDRVYTREWLKASRRDADPKTKPSDPEVPPLFRSGEALNALPADAVAIAQQMVLWAPLDANLLWLLGAVYLEKGQFTEAFDILEQCRERKLTWPKFRAHHANAQAGYSALPKVDPFAGQTAVVGAVEPVTPPQPPRPFDIVSRERFLLVTAVFAVLIAAIAFLQIRKLVRRSPPHVIPRAD